MREQKCLADFQVPALRGDTPAAQRVNNASYPGIKFNPLFQIELISTGLHCSQDIRKEFILISYS